MSRDFRAYWAAEVTSTFGSMLTATAVGIIAVNNLDASASQVGIVVAAGMLPTLLFGLLSGALADRVRRPRRVLIVADAVATVAVGVLALTVGTGTASVAWLAVFNLLLGTLSVLIAPVYFTHLSALVGGADRAGQQADEVVRARARLQTGQYTARITGRAAAGPIIAVGAAFGLIVDALTYVASMLLLLSIKVPDHGAARPEQERDSSIGAQIAEGVRELNRQRFLRRLVTFLLVLSLVSGGVTALTAPFLLRTLGVPVQLFGLLYAVTGAAGLVGSLIATRLVSRISTRTLALFGFAGAAATMLIFPAAGGGLVLAGVIAGLGAALPILFGAIANVGLTGVMTTEVAPHLLGRVTATIQTSLTVTTFLGALGAGILGDAIGVRAALFCCGFLALAGLLLLAAGRRTAWPVAAPDDIRRTDATEVDEAPAVAAGPVGVASA